MRKSTKIWLIVAASLVLLGCVLFAGLMSTLGWDFEKLATVQYETNTFEINETFDGISVNTTTADIIFVFSNDGKCRVECYEEENAKHSATVKDGILTVELIDKRSVYDFIGINLDSPKVTVCLPEREYVSLLIAENTGDIGIPKDFTFQEVSISSSTGDVDFYASASEMVRIKTSTGDIHVKNMSTGALDLSVSTGKVTVSDVTCRGDINVEVSTGKAHLTDIACKSVISSGSTGDISLNHVIAAEKFSIRRSTGDINFERSDAAEIFAKTDTGDVTGTLFTDKMYMIQTDTGSVDVPKNTTGGKCEIITTTGDIKITVV